MAPSLSSGVGASWQPDGRAVFRTASHGGRVVVIPMRCPSGLHVLTEVGYGAWEGEYPYGDFGRIPWVNCRACSDAPRADHSWALMLGEQRANSAEFDDEPYAELLGTAPTR